MVRTRPCSPDCVAGRVTVGMAPTTTALLPPPLPQQPPSLLLLLLPPQRKGDHVASLTATGADGRWARVHIRGLSWATQIRARGSG